MSKTWDDRIIDYIREFSQDFNNPGECIATLIEEFFPQSESDIFSLIPERSKNLFKPGVIENEVKNCQNNLKRLLQNLKLYRDDYENKKRHYYINNLINQCNNLYKKFFNNSDVIQLIPINITFSLIHLTILRERQQFEDEINENLEEQWEMELQQKVDLYIKYFVEIYPKWQEWRKQQIIVKTGINEQKKSYGEVFDTLTKRSVSYTPVETPYQSKTFFVNVCDRTKRRLFNESNAEFMKIYMYTFTLNKFKVGYYGYPTIADPPSVGTLWFGVYGRDTFPDGTHVSDDAEVKYELSTDKPNTITGININEYNIIDALKFFYNNRSGTLVGNSKGGHLTTIRGLNNQFNYVIAVDLYFNYRILCAIEFHFSNGESTGVLGNRIKADAEKVSCGPIGKNNDFKLIGVSMASGKADPPEYFEGVAYISLCFQHVRVGE
ncbi:hypothetical protein RclHR1_00020063 [Rhizophagus clarus]|uniref:Uncharacterized protein n=1 Tax=Rhizophagus clarus TaxID=94130 RepID=A0A2Z6QQJ8_9GLOM|nr:hypothetical protein RclHR1_00020063 [Rhizophagus clarus]GES80195.1 hypothetical protein GLOIN_2v1566377 [Rhizophagus clarus]